MCVCVCVCVCVCLSGVCFAGCLAWPPWWGQTVKILARRRLPQTSGQGSSTRCFSLSYTTFCHSSPNFFFLIRWVAPFPFSSPFLPLVPSHVFFPLACIQRKPFTVFSLPYFCHGFISADGCICLCFLYTCLKIIIVNEQRKHYGRNAVGCCVDGNDDVGACVQCK